MQYPVQYSEEPVNNVIWRPTCTPRELRFIVPVLIKLYPYTPGMTIPDDVKRLTLIYHVSKRANGGYLYKLEGAE